MMEHGNPPPEGRRGRRLAPSEVLQAGPVDMAELPGGRLALRHAGGLTVLGGVGREEVATLLAAVDGRRTAAEVVDAVAHGLPTRRASTLLRLLFGEVLGVGEAGGEEGREEGERERGKTGEAPPPPRAAVGLVGDGPFARALTHALSARFEVRAIPLLGSAPGTPRDDLAAVALVICAPEMADYRELLAFQERLLEAGTACLFVTTDPDGPRLGPTVVPGPVPGPVPGSGPCFACAQLGALESALRAGGGDAPAEGAGSATALLEASGAFSSHLPTDPALRERLATAVVAEVRALLAPPASGFLPDPRTLGGILHLRPGEGGGWRLLPLARHPACPLCSGPFSSGLPSSSPPSSGLGASDPGPSESAGPLLRHRAVRLGAEAWNREPLRAEPAGDREPVRSVGILGGGTAGHLTALALRRGVPGLAVTLIESPELPVIGVGEATTPLMPQFLHGDLGLPASELFAEVRPTFKLGIRFLWGLPGTGDFPYPFGHLHLLEAHSYSGELAAASLGGLLMAAAAVPFYREGAGLALPHFGGRAAPGSGTLLAYHLDNAPFVAWLARRAAEAGVEREEATVVRAETRGEGEEISALITREGRRLAFDLYVDASGFRSALVGEALGSPWVSFAGSLPTDGAIAAQVPHGGTLRPYTTAETMGAGWCWSTPQAEADHRGYVFASAFLSADEAEAEMRRACPGMGEARRLRFRSGRHAEFWKGNAVALGNAYGFVEPLESTALHMLIRQIGLLVRAFPLGRRERALAARLNTRVGAWWDYLRWFLALHYRFNRRIDSPFWRFCREEVDVSSHGELLELYRERGPLSYDPASREAFDYPDPLWGPEGIDTLLLGQGVLPARLPRPRLGAGAWEDRLRLARMAVGRALGHREALDLLGRDPALLARLEDAFRAAGAAFPGRAGPDRPPRAPF